MRIKYLGHAGFVIDDLVIDPFIRKNPLSNVEVEDVDCQILCITHAHHDHMGDAFEIALNNDAVVISSPEVTEQAVSKGLRTESMNIGGCIKVGDWMVKMVEALHSSQVGHPAGFVLKKSGKTIYHAGDTGLFLDMQLIGEMDINIAMLPIGDRYTMGVDDALRAVEFVKPDLVIPMHFNTFPAVKSDAREFKKRCREAEVRIFEVGMEKEF